MAVHVLDAFPRARLTVTDVDPAMVTVARERLARFGDRATVQLANATALPFEGESFDTVLSFIMLHHVVDWEAALSETLRVLRPTGVLVGYDLLSTLPMRLLHRAEGHPFEFMSMDAFRGGAAKLSVEEASLRSDFLGFAVRFVLVKSLPDS